jgi:hypothetical protein
LAEIKVHHPHGDEATNELMKAFGLDPLKVTKMQFTMEVGAITRVAVESYVSTEQVAELGKVLKKYNVMLEDIVNG